jgi:catechol-2,3-dioxygenase
MENRMKRLALQLDHLAFPAFDPEETWRFYEEVMRLPLTDVSTGGQEDEPWLMMSFGLADGRQLAFFTVKDMERREQDGVPDWFYHYAFSAASAAALHDWKEHLGKLGVEFSEESHGEQHSIYLSDPNGILLEVNYPPSTPPPERKETGDAKVFRMRRWAQTNL